MDVLSIALFAAAALGLLVLAIQAACVRRHVRREVPIPETTPAISILKPLCGIDDGLAGNLEHFANLPYPSYELVLGVKSPDDPAWRVALGVARRHPDRVRVVVQQGAPGLNPKVNQLVTLAAAARHELLVISDSNVRVERGYLHEIAAHLEDPSVGLVTHPIAGVREQSLGSLFESLQLTCTTSPGSIVAKRLLGRDLVTGKSMAMRRADLAAVGGFHAVKDVLAEDFVLGVQIPARTGKRVVLASTPVQNVTERRSLADFVRRFGRWAVIQRKIAGNGAYLAQLLLHPTVLALGAFLATPGLEQGVALSAVVAAKILVEAIQGAELRDGGFELAGLLLVPLKDLVAGWAWLHGLLRDTVDWRGNVLLVLPGTRLAALPDDEEADALEQVA